MTGSKIFLDTAPLIYLIEGHADFEAPVADYLESTPPSTEFHTSVLTWTEFVVKPSRLGKVGWELLLRRTFELLDCRIHPVSFFLADEAVHLRTRYSFLKAVDGLQLATAIAVGCDTFLTNDSKLKVVKELQVVLVSELATL